ncbi:hypothetical protein [Cardinium endosymbiont of Tipula unca]|uniref:hypothetical protein n=1 Tax=Cardinium endosymbiont of Tipula unca TaxID=3066216 RepID=UPI0030D3F94B
MINHYFLSGIRVIVISLVMISNFLLHATAHNNPTTRYKKKYVDFPSWTIYLYNHPGYHDYQLPNNITKHGCRWGNWVTFAQKIEAIQAYVGRFTHPSDLLRSKDFLAIYKHPDYYKQVMLGYLSSKNYALEQKKIAIYANIQNGLWLCEASYKLYKEKN